MLENKISWKVLKIVFSMDFAEDFVPKVKKHSEAGEHKNSSLSFGGQDHPLTFSLNNIYFIILYIYNYYIASRDNTQYNEWDTEESQ